MRFTAFLFGALAALLGALLHATFLSAGSNMAAPHLLRNSLPILSRWSSRLQHAVYKSAPAAASLFAQSPASPLPASIPHTTTPLASRFSTSATMAANKSFLDAVKERRTYYQLNNTSPVSDDRIVEIVNDTILSVPSSFNSQSTRVVVLLKKEHEKFWDLTKEVLKPQVPADAFPSTEAKLNGFKAGYGTILFFEDPQPVKDLQSKFALYAAHFPVWSEHTSAMHQFVLWAGLEAEGFGANLQHYNPVVDRKVQDEWKVPQEWQLRAQLVFGGRAGEPGPKDQKPLGDRVFVHGK